MYSSTCARVFTFNLRIQSYFNRKYIHLPKDIAATHVYVIHGARRYFWLNGSRRRRCRCCDAIKFYRKTFVTVCLLYDTEMRRNGISGKVFVHAKSAFSPNLSVRMRQSKATLTR